MRGMLCDTGCMKYRPIEKPILHPILGFGIAGWFLVLILLAVIVMIATGYDLYSAVMWQIANMFGGQSVVDISIYYVLFSVQYAASLQPTPTIVTLVVLLPCIWVSPSRRFRNTLIALLVLQSVCFPLYVFMKMHTPLGSLGPGHSGFLIWIASPFTLELLLHPAIAGVIYLHTRSKSLVSLVLLTWLWYGLPGYVGFKLGVDFSWIPVIPNVAEIPIAAVLWHAALFAIFMRWAILKRRDIKTSSHCWHCNYDLTVHNPAKPCPECGNEIPEDHPLRAPLAAAGEKPSASTA